MILTVTLNPAVDKLYTVPSVLTGAVNRVVDTITLAGGKGINVSKTVKSLGGETFAVGFIAGRFGEFITDKLNDLNIPHEFIKVSGETRISAAVTDLSTGQVTEFLENGFNVIQADIDTFFSLYEKRIGLMGSDDMVVISGSMPNGCPPEVYGELIMAAKKLGLRTILDTSGDNLKTGIKSAPYMIKPNLAELCGLFENKSVKNIETVKAAAESLLKYGIKYVCVTMGEGGAVLACSEGAFFHPAEAITPKRTVGCGDALVAAFAIGIQNKKPPEENLAFGIKIATQYAMEYKYF